MSEDEVDYAISLLAELPAEPSADRPGDGVDELLNPDRVRQARKNIGGRTASKETTVLFVSDTHLGYENRVKTGSGSTVSWVRDISSRETFERILQIATEQSVDAIIHTGDILDHEVDEATLSTTESFLSALSALDIPVYCIIGSHDHNSADPQHPNSVDGIAWLKEQVNQGHLVELTTDQTPVAGGPLDAYGISAENVGIDDVGKYHSREWSPSDITFGVASSGPNVLCLHDGFTPYRSSKADVDLNHLLAQARVSFDCVGSVEILFFRHVFP
ncbi:metallophosphoesterase [Natronomonas amylolytica]|uniref:metallophosphoesterase n=1 Tax=Natronomonas amylolytica TaxID=3108498 RepID=UPI00300A132F